MSFILIGYFVLQVSATSEQKVELYLGKHPTVTSCRLEEALLTSRVKTWPEANSEGYPRIDYTTECVEVE